MTTPSHSRGFTLVELNLAIVFVAILLMAVAMTIIGVSRTYEYGVALKSVNQSGREVMDQIRRDLAATQPGQFAFEQSDGIGRLCLGAVSYVYNDAALLNDTGPVDKVEDQTVSPARPITLARIDDASGSWCKQDGSGTYDKNDIDATESFSEILPRDIVPLAVHSLDASVLSQSSESSFPESLVQFGMTFGTNETESITGERCKPPTEAGQNFTNCAVREFATVVRIIGGDNG